MIDVKQFREYIVIPTLNLLEMDTPAAVELVLGTAIQESRLTYLHQLGGGPAVGVFQMEPATHDDIWDNYLRYRVPLSSQLNSMAMGDPTIAGGARQMAGNLYYACAMCRLHYYRVPHPLPQVGDTPGMAEYWKEHYNTYEGAGTVEEYVEHWGEATFGMR